MPLPVLCRWLAFCLPAGLFYLWRRQYRWGLLRKLVISCLSIVLTAVLWAGVLNLFTRPIPILAQANAVVLQRDIYPLVADLHGTTYHLAGCVHAPEDAVPITLDTAAQRKIPADERCNPPRYKTKRR